MSRDDVPDICRRICQQADGHCIGCGRTPVEIKSWRTYTPAQAKLIARIAEARVRRDISS